MIKYFVEIKNRIFLLLITIFSTLLISYSYKETLLFLIVQPERLIFKSGNLTAFYFIFTNVTEILSVYIQLITFLGFQTCFLYTIYHCSVFLSPAMFKSEYSFIFGFLKVIIVIWFFSVLLSHFLLIPITWDFFYSFQELFSSKFVNLHFEAKLPEYIDFYVSLYYLCVIYFQVFTILFFFLNYIGDKTKIIQKFRKIYYYFFVVFSTLISPPDLFSQFFISLFLIFVYEILVFSLLIKEILVRKPVKTN
jgi:sec-independent protein translocase protein TatC